MSREPKVDRDTTSESAKTKPILGSVIGAIITILLIVVTLDVSHRRVSAFVSNQERYVLAIEAAVLSLFIVEMLVRLISARFHTVLRIERGIQLRLFVRIGGYSVALLSVISILASNATLGISVGAIVGVVMAFAAQSIVGSILATILIVSTHLVRVGEEITINQAKGTISDISLTHTVIAVDDDVVFVPNSLIISSLVRRKKRASDVFTSIHDDQ